MPFGSSGTYEQEVEIHFHPPRSAEAESRIWELEVAGESKAYSRQAAVAPLHLGIQPFEEFKTKLSPERASGRKKAQYDVAVKNTANAPVTVALDAADTDNELDYKFTPATMEIPPGQSITSKMLVKPPRKRWIGRPEEKRIQVFTKTGEEANQAKTAEDMELPEGEGEEGAEEGAKPKRKGLKQRLRITGPRAQVGTSGVRLSGPRVAKPRIPSKNVDLMKLKAPGSGAPAAQMPLMPNQVVFRHKAYLPWWVPLLLPLLLLLALLLFLFLPKNVVVPEVTGAKSTFAAEKTLTDAELKLSAATKQKVTTEAPPGTVIGQTPARRREGGEGLRGRDRDRGRQRQDRGPERGRQDAGRRGSDPAQGEPHGRPGLTAAARPQGQDLQPDPRGQGDRQGGHADRHLHRRPARQEEGRRQGRREERRQGRRRRRQGRRGRAAHAGRAAPVAEAAQKAAEAGLVPEQVNQFSGKKKGTLIGTIPPAGTKLKEGDKIKLLVSAGFPQLAFDDGENVLLANGANGKRLPAIAKGSQEETDPTWSFDGTQVAYASNRRVFLKNQAKPDEPAVAVTPADEVYSDLAWAPTLDVNLIAMLRDKSKDKNHKRPGPVPAPALEAAGPGPVHPQPERQPGQDGALGARRQVDLRPRPDGRRSQASPDSRFGMVQLQVQEAVLARTPRTGARASSSRTSRTSARA